MRVVWSRRAARLTALAAVGVALVGLFGWVAGIPELQAFIRGRPVITPNTAVGLLLLAAAALLRAPADAPRGRRAAAHVCALIVLAIDVAALLHYLAGIDLKIDGLVPALLPPGGDAVLPTRMAVVTAFCQLLVAAAVLLFDARWRGWTRLAEAPTLVAGAISLAALTGHVYGAESLYQSTLSPLRGMSLPATLGLALLTVSVLFARPDRGLMATILSPRVGGLMARRLLVPALVGPGCLGFIVLSLVNAGYDGPRVSLMHAVLVTGIAVIAGGLTLLTAASLNRLDEMRAVATDELRMWRDVVDQADDAVVVKARDGTVIGWNPAAERLFGWRRDEIVGRSLLLLVPEERRGELSAAEARLARGERISALETVRLAKDGTPIDVSMSLANFRDSAGQRVGMAAVVRDLRERKAAERRYADLFEHASDGIFVADLSGRIVEVNAAGCRLLGRACEEVVGRSIHEFIPAADAARMAAMRDALLRGAVEVGDWQLVASDGAQIPVEASATIRDGHWRLFVRDLRVRKAAEEALARLYLEEARVKTWLQGVIDGMPEAVLLIDAEGRLSHNKVASGFIAAGDGAPRFDLRGPDDAPIPWSELPLMRALSHGETCSGRELVAHDAHGRRVPLLVSASPLRDATGRRVGAVSVLRDISVLKDMARLREEWTALVAHDLRQPLNVISVSAQTLARTLAPASDSLSAKALGRIRGAADRLSRMIRDLLDAARIDARRLTVERAPVDLRDLLAEVAARTAAGAGRPIRVDLPPVLPRVLADACRIDQVMENLLTNALKYGEPGGDIVVTAGLQDGSVVVSTSNRGADLSPEEIEQLFTRFYRSRSGGSAEGLGLGLHITRGLVEAHGGRIWAESAGQTTTFRFTLPIA